MVRVGRAEQRRCCSTSIVFIYHSHNYTRPYTLFENPMTFNVFGLKIIKKREERKEGIVIIFYVCNFFVEPTPAKRVTTEMGECPGCESCTTACPQKWVNVEVEADHRWANEMVMSSISKYAIKLIYCPWGGGGVWIILALPKSV